MTEASLLEAARAALAGQEAWLVGGAVRDALLGRPPADDLDLVVAGDPGEAARALARAAGGTAFALSEAFGAWRVAGPGGRWQADLTGLDAPTLEANLARRDFTVNAMASPLAGGEIVDPLGGAADLRAGVLRLAGPDAFAADPLRTLRLARLACELGLAPDALTLAGARDHAAGLAQVAPERVFGELCRIVSADAALSGLRLADEVGATAVVLPELAALHGVQQSAYHHLDVHDHTLAVLAEAIALERDPEPALGPRAAAAGAVLAEPLADGLTRWQALRWGALLHDGGKPATAAAASDGRITFWHHDTVGADLAAAALGRLRASRALRDHVAALTRHHLRLGFLVHERPLSRRAVYRYLDACGPVAVDVTVLSVADRLATRGRRADEAIPKHLDLAGEILGDALAWRAEGPPRPLLRGDDLAAQLGLEPGPELGGLLAQLAEAQYAGEIADRDDALRLARELAGPGGG
ncbi:MAG: HDIG domain-containing protein [Solirubrobacteraceae bacterium]